MQAVDSITTTLDVPPVLMPKIHLAPDMLGRFAVVKLWPELKTAEDECIARLKIAADQLGISCVEVDARGRLLDKPDEVVNHRTVDFVLHLHYDTPKLYDAFSIVALWNPIDFYHKWGYFRTSRNLVTHDDFVSCDSIAADDQVRRMIRGRNTHLPPKLRLYHTTPGNRHTPNLAEFKLFYIGINWEAINGGKSRHQELLKALDRLSVIKIYGPQKFQGVAVWSGYNGYVNEVPFDGYSVIDEIAKAGIALVLSSAAHKESGLMSNRLFEAVSAGALVICDENPWARRHFGDSLLYIDTQRPTEEVVAQILSHIEWAKANQGAAIAKISESQNILEQRFNLVNNLKELYETLDSRKTDLQLLQNNGFEPLKVKGYHLLLSYDDAALTRHINSALSQQYPNYQPVVVRGSQYSDTELAALNAACNDKLETVVVENLTDSGQVKTTGQLIHELIDQAEVDVDAICFVAPNESLLSNHIQVLADSLNRHPTAGSVAVAAVIEPDATQVPNSSSDLIDFGHVDKSAPPGYARFLFRRSLLPDDLRIGLAHLHGRPLALLVAGHELVQELPATVMIRVDEWFPTGKWNDAHEQEVIREYSKDSNLLFLGPIPKPKLHDVTHLRSMPKAHPVPPMGIGLVDLVTFAATHPRWVGQQFRLIREHGVARRWREFRRVVSL